MKTKEQILEIIENCKEGREDCSKADSRKVYQGWIEALEWVMREDN